MKTIEVPDNFPKIICLCGSTKFKKEFEEISKKLTLQGYIVLGIFIFKEDKIDFTEEQISELFELQLKRIVISDEVFVVNIGGYIGDSTKRELNCAKGFGKVIRFLEPFGAPYVRDLEHPCNNFEPIKIYGEWLIKECRTDGHYLCKECRFKAPQTEEEVEELNKKLKGN